MKRITVGLCTHPAHGRDAAEPIYVVNQDLCTCGYMPREIVRVGPGGWSDALCVDVSHRSKDPVEHRTDYRPLDLRNVDEGTARLLYEALHVHFDGGVQS